MLAERKQALYCQMNAKKGRGNVDEGLMDKNRDKRFSIKNCLEGIGVISKIGETGVSSGGCFARGQVNVICMADSFASRGCRGSGDQSFKTNCSSKGNSGRSGCLGWFDRLRKCEGKDGGT